MNKKYAPPRLRRKETKSERRFFRFTPSNKTQLETLNKRYGGEDGGCDVSKVMDILIEASKDQKFQKLLDEFVQTNYPVI